MGTRHDIASDYVSSLPECDCLAQIIAAFHPVEAWDLLNQIYQLMNINESSIIPTGEDMTDPVRDLRDRITDYFASCEFGIA